MSQQIVRRALEKKLATWATANSLTVAYENVDFTPPDGAYIRANLLPANTLSETLDRLHRRYSGVFQVTLMMPRGTGPAAAESLVASLVTEFTPSATITESSVRVYILDPASAASAIQDMDRYIVPVSINYEAHVV